MYIIVVFKPAMIETLERNDGSARSTTAAMASVQRGELRHEVR